VAWLVGGLSVAIVELVALGSARPSLAWTVITLLAALGLLAGLAISWQARLVRGMGPLARAAGMALLATPLFVFVAAHLFDGGFAATLPGASWGMLWVPILGTALTAAAVYGADRIMRRWQSRGLIAVALIMATVVVEYGNRTVLVSEYPDVHALLVVAAVIMAGAAVHLGVPDPGLAGWRALRVVTLAAAAAVGLSLVLVLFHGLDDRGDRWLVASRGMHARQIARVVRAALDRDGDGYAALLGGGDCDEGDAALNPGAVDTPGNGRDEDCDGADAEIVVREPTEVDIDQATAAWRASPELARILASTREYHLVFIVVDALRADLLAPTAENRAAYPHLHALAAQARRFTRVFSPASGTDVSLSALLTGRINPFVRVPATMPEALAATGRATHAVLPREVLRWAGETLVTRGLRSFDRVISDRVKRDVGSHSTAHETTERGLAFLDGHTGGPMFLWLHYFDVHEHHQIEATDARLSQVLGNEAPDSAGKYRAAARLVDAEIGRVIGALEQRGIWDRSVVILVSDHGESLGEDPRLPDAHGRFVYNPLVHVPLLIRVPGVAPAVIDTPMSLLDVTPTILALAGARPMPGMDGQDLLPYLFADEVAGLGGRALARARPIVLNESEQYGVIDWPYKLLVRPADNLIELYDLAADFGESRDLSAEQPEIISRLKSVYQGFPAVVVDRSLKARKAREDLARPSGD
jgi:hypothetical protein